MVLDEDNYAARVARVMWRMAKRRVSARANETLIETAHSSVADIGSPLDAPLAQDANAPADEPRTLQEFLSALASELVQDDRDRGAS